MFNITISEYVIWIWFVGSIKFGCGSVWLKKEEDREMESETMKDRESREDDKRIVCET